MINAGNLNRCLDLERVTETQSSSGAVVQTWTMIASVWASIKPLSGREFVNAEQVGSNVTHRIMIRYRNGVVPKMRLVKKTRIFNIMSVIDIDDAHEVLELICREVV